MTEMLTKLTLKDHEPIKVNRYYLDACSLSDWIELAPKNALVEERAREYCIQLGFARDKSSFDLLQHFLKVSSEHFGDFQSMESILKKKENVIDMIARILSWEIWNRQLDGQVRHDTIEPLLFAVRNITPDIAHWSGLTYYTLGWEDELDFTKLRNFLTYQVGVTEEDFAYEHSCVEDIPGKE